MYCCAPFSLAFPDVVGRRRLEAPAKEGRCAHVGRVFGVLKRSFLIDLTQLLFQFLSHSIPNHSSSSVPINHIVSYPSVGLSLTSDLSQTFLTAAYDI
ncbi:hypothetical protein CEXT_205711 [Caerostris extrusa]|uniref:Uncharacterized protein n=1 Tax=Caerostris extrusa TaxID=172846 RepID=A0AAV4W5K4_CAEEX|nr:hypothetical protein CEXT_205711 [Caerostris extrusa]